MKNIYCETLNEYTNLPKSFTEYTTIHIRFTDWVDVVARENSNVVARENSNVVARENSNVVARENSNVVARGNSRVEAWENSNVVAWENSNVVARENSRVVAWGNSRVVAWENSRVEAWENSRVEAWENCAVHNFSEDTTLKIMFYAVCFMVKITKNMKKSKTATIINPSYDNTIHTFLEMNDVKKLDKDTVLLIKRVSKELKTQENTSNETVWSIGKTLEVPVWNPTEECGEGKFHACSRTFFCDQFRSNVGDRYIAISVKIGDLYTHKNPQFPHKIAFRKGRVMYEIDRDGNKI